MEQNNEDLLLSSKFVTRDELLVFVRDYYSKRGYALSILRSNAEQSVLLQCDRGGHYRNTRNITEDQRKKITATRLINCPFQLYGKKQKDGGMWTIEIRNNSHNHEPSTDIFGHPSFRQLTNGELKIVEHMTNSGAPPRQIISSLRQNNPSTRVISKTIYNAKNKIQKSNLDGKTIIQALFEELGKAGYMYNILRDAVGHITHLFLANPRSVMLTKTFPNVFVMDCTYKTNKYKMPLLDIVGITSFNTSFYSAFVFLERETTENYIWALEMFKKILGLEKPSVIITDRELALMNAIKVVFPSVPNILCVWHINKNILGKCKKFFETEESWDAFLSDWKTIMYSSTEHEYRDSLRGFELKYKEKKIALQYINKTWLPLKEKFVGAWTDIHLHLGNRATSRAEGAHAKLKKYLQVSTGNLHNVKKKISLAVENEFNEIKVQLAREKLHVPHICNIPFFRNLIYRISLYALRELYKQYEMATRGTMNPICTGQFMATMGMPCAHQMENWKTGSLSLDQIHLQWRIDTRELNELDSNLIANPDDQMKYLLDDFYKEYLKWPLDRKKLAQEKIKELVNHSEVIFEPTIPTAENRFITSKKRKAISSTRRKPSQFEIAEATWQCSTSNKVTQHNERHQEAAQAIAEFEVPTVIDDNSVFDWIDSNM